MGEVTPRLWPHGRWPDLQEPWARQAELDYGSLLAEAGQHWRAIVEHAVELPSTKPSTRWQKTAATLLEAIGPSQFESHVIRWFDLACEPRDGDELPSRWRLASSSSDILRGLVWIAAVIPSDELIRAIAALGIATFRKFPGEGIRSVRVGNACIHALGSIGNAAALGQLAILKARIKGPSTQKEISKALTAVAGKIGVSPDELEEMAVPSYGLTSVGRLEEPLGDFTAELSIQPTGKCELVWRKVDGKIQKSVPAAIKAEHADELKDLKGAIKDIEKMLPAQRDRIDSLFLEEKRWPAEVWRERYLDHPLVGVLARRLVWQFTNTGLSASGVWSNCVGENGEIVNVDGEAIDWIDAEGTTVELWHPIGRPMDDVLSWRGWLERHEVRQPFKQAHREVYVLTDAERNTRTYSNRYAAHVIRQHQFHALCAARGWKSQLRLMVDAEVSPPTKVLETWGLRVEFWVEPIGEQWGVDTTESGAFKYLATDQVRFYRLDAARQVAHATGGRYFSEGLRTPINEPLPLEVIPPVVFSEVMRDVDLFVGVSSVGNDPTWADGGPEGLYREYWQQYSFGDLTASAQTRKDVLERLIPRLKIAARCSFDSKFLKVRGDLRTYKIHLGSGNILMEPNDQYLCIVPDSRSLAKGDNVFLPFEGDRTLSIILSKAFLLAEDRKITDSTITRQIGG